MVLQARLWMRERCSAIAGVGARELRERQQIRAVRARRVVSACCIILVEEALRRITPKRLRCIGWLQRRTLMRRRTAWAVCTTNALALLMTLLRRCGCTSLLPPKEILQHCSMSVSFTSAVEAFL